MLFRFVIALATTASLSACVPATTGSGSDFPENNDAASCYTGYHAFDLQVHLPADAGELRALTQFSEAGGQLSSQCRLDITDVASHSPGYPIYTGEVDTGNAGLCVSARTTARGHILSCASRAQVARAVDAPLGTTGSVLRLTDWQPYPGI